MEQLSLFDADDHYQFPTDLLDYRQNFLSDDEAYDLMNTLLKDTPWVQTSQKMYDKILTTPRLIAWFSDLSKFSQDDKRLVDFNEWTPELLQLKEKIEAVCGESFNAVLLNLYRNENDSVAWHKDKQDKFKKKPVIASVSLGQTRDFDFRKVGESKKSYSLPLHNGSLLIMKADLHTAWEHRIAKTRIAMQPRINLTFRTISINNLLNH
ncbi:alpha-ketoglutarate-dependent dioxygenase AlkB [Chryseobacterium chendengshani]|uniref:alpha-ketoglutarate-dependent dioxygenase AlkB family protein n=1 Tax=Chryseobacterium sp. LJ668 TaxID=2864040 RepID=UPI001C68A5BE|nr:alpha-ketoglutarate-dependent dioxygenase AlkB [Chryseobacterium sp. LJ668]MBW8523726.1 alpha-ketoglutarate-dependent dioxygenase AlkB [Chryseobacterium sp. LJ668]QYK16670.1 alpha-ketoglutarate-dependent dioxygenase AlkB [Chryseobacterium sp. LJ668]